MLDHMVVLFFFFFLFNWLRWLFVAVQGLSLVVESRGYSLVAVGLLVCAWALCCGSQAFSSSSGSFSCCGTQALELMGSVVTVLHGLSHPEHRGS